MNLIALALLLHSSFALKRLTVIFVRIGTDYRYRTVGELVAQVDSYSYT